MFKDNRNAKKEFLHKAFYAMTVKKPSCPACKSLMIRRTAKLRIGTFWGCTNFPKCKGTRPIIVPPDFFDSSSSDYRKISP